MTCGSPSLKIEGYTPPYSSKMLNRSAPFLIGYMLKQCPPLVNSGGLVIISLINTYNTYTKSHTFLMPIN